MDDKDKKIESLQAEIVGLKVRLKRIEDFILAFPSGEDFVREFDYQEEPDDLFSQAAQAALEYNRASASLLQRQLSVGYARAARLIDQLTSKEFITQSDGTSKPREVFPEKIREYLESNPAPEMVKIKQIKDIDELFNQAAKVVLKHRTAASVIQWHLLVGYVRSARLIDQLAEAGLISPSDGTSSPRIVYKDKIKKYVAELD